MKYQSSSRSAAFLAATVLSLASFGVAFAQTAPAASPSADPVHVMNGPLPAVATPSPKQKASILQTKNTRATTKQDKLKTGFVSGKNLTTNTVAPSGSTCIATQTPQSTQQMQANTGQPVQPLVDFPVDGSTSIASATARDQAAHACNNRNVSP